MVDYAPGEPEEEPPLEMTLEEQPVTKATSESVADIGRVKTLSWLSQLSVVLHKNLLLLWRRPVMFSCMLLSSVFSVILAITVGQDVEFDKVVVTACGTVDDNYYRSFDDSNDYTAKYNIPLSYNENWRSGLAVTLMALGPMVQAICCFLVVHNEIQTKMLGVLRGLGLRESVYWISWFIPFLLTSLVNSLLGAITAALIPIHVYQNTNFGAILGALFFLQIALVSSSLFVAALLGTSRRGATWLILIMLVAPWVPQIYLTRYLPSASNQIYNGMANTPMGLFWVYGNTTTVVSTWSTSGQNTTYSTCEAPILSESEGRFFKTEEERLRVDPNEWFVGCYVAAGLTSDLYNGPGSKFGTTAAMFFFPYTHFNTIWGNILGFTGMHQKQFGFEHARMSPEELAIESLPKPPDADNGKGTTLFPQGSTLSLKLYENPDYFNYNKQNCPMDNLTDYFCDNFYNCVAAPEPAPTEDSPSVLDMFGFLVSLCVIYMSAAAYWAQVFPGQNGAPQKFYFFLLPRYWLGDRAKESSQEKREQGVVISEVRKQYDDFEAVKGVSMRMESGSVTALLGHNGAGKTSLSHVICCETAATTGDVSVYGHSVTQNAFTVRQLVGICKQDDYLYPNLSAKEHLELFAGLRGVPRNERPAIIQEWLESVDLAIEQNQYSSSFSGGMKRRLSVACSTIGDRPLIILDEPTTGMDPISRRFVWRHIESVKAGRVILLTTHAMEEADLLADSVAVMAKGTLAAFGTPLELKAKYGSALQFTILVPSDIVESTSTAIVDRFPEGADWVFVEPGSAGNISVNITKIRSDEQSEGVSVENLAAFVDWLENDESGVSEYGFSNSSLEEVFLKVTQEFDDEEVKNDSDDEVDVCCSSCSPGCLRCCLSGPCRGCCCRTKAHQIDEEHEQENDEDAEEDAEDNGEGEVNEIASFKPSLNVRTQIVALVINNLKRNWSGKGSIGNWILISLLMVGNLIMGVTGAASYDAIPSFTYQTVAISLLSITLVSPLYLDRHHGLFYLMRTQGLLERSYVFGHGFYALLVAFVFGVLLLTLLFATPLFREPDICPPNGAWCQHTLGSPPMHNPTVLWYDTSQDPPATLYATPAPGGYGKVFGVAVVFALTAPGALLSSSYLPGYKFALICISFFGLLAGMIPFVTYYLLPALKQSDEDDEENPCNLKVCDTAIEWSIDNIDAGKDFLNCMGLKIHEQSLGSLCLPHVAALLPQYGLFQGLASTFMSKIVFMSDRPGYVEQVLVPSMGGNIDCTGNICSFPFAQELYGWNMGYMVFGGLLLLVIGYAQVMLFSFPGRRANIIRNFFSQGVACFMLKFEEKPDPAQESTQSNAVSEEVALESEKVASIVKPLLKAPTPQAMEEGDDKNFTLANHSELPRDELPPVLMYKLRKVYPALGGVPPKVALDSLDLHIPRGEVLGFLGKNGAGKTTALKILSISHQASSGLALVAGYDVSCETIQVFERLGNCPQFDLVWPGQSVQLHLEFFAQLKGLPKDKVKKIALSIATAVGLGSPAFYGRNAGSLSGGMRRRLSIAISLIGAPDVLLLDEPSTGLDPSTRNSIWNLVKSFATKERAVAITTHSMIEADILSTRIAIVAQGRLKIVATQQHLKNKFGCGYLLQLNLTKSTVENQESAMNFVRQRIHKNATLQTKQAKTLHIALPRDVDLTDVFRALYSSQSSTEGCINQFLLSQSSLEDVFIALAD